MFGGQLLLRTLIMVCQLRAEAQDEAIKTVGFNEDHISILNSPFAAIKIRKLLATFANRK